jgi:hypothetical protein
MSRKVRVVYAIHLSHGGDIILDLEPGESAAEHFRNLKPDALSDVFPFWLFKRCNIEINDIYYEEINEDC